MTSSRDKLRASLLLLFAAAAPWDVFLFVPGLQIRLTWVLAAALLGAEFGDFLDTRNIGVRFELLWPACALLILALPPMYIVSSRGVLAVLLGLAAARLGSPLLARQVLTVFAFSAGALAFLTLLFFVLRHAAPGTAPAPVAYSLETGLTMPFGHTVLECAVLLFAGFAAVCPRCVSRGGASRYMRGALLVLALVLLAALGTLAVFAAEHVGLWQPPDYFATVGTAVAALIGAWLVARILAKSFVAWRETGGTVFTDTACLMTGLGVVALLLPLEFRPFWGFLAGTAAGAGQALKTPALLPRKWALALIPVALLAAANFKGVHPADRSHPRHYEAAARRDFANRDHERLEHRMDYVETYWPAERRTHLWRARTALARRLLHEAAYELGQASKPRDELTLLLPAPDAAESDGFLVRLRDACSQSDAKTATLAHVQALVGTRKYNHAAALLAQALDEAALIELPAGLSPDLEAASHAHLHSWPFRVAALKTAAPVHLGVPRELDALLAEDLTGAHWLRLLLSWGAELHAAPPNFPRDALPVIAIAKCRRASIELACISGMALLARTDTMVHAPLHYDPAGRYNAFELLPDSNAAYAVWRQPEQDPAGVWRIGLDIQGITTAVIELDNGIALTTKPPEQPLSAREAPIISIWL